MKSKAFAKLALAVIRHPRQTVQVFRSLRNSSSQTRKDHLSRAAEWLLQCQRFAPDGAGYSRRYSLIRGWDRCYIETTGYIIPTLFDTARILGNDKFSVSANKAAQWLLTVQQPDGSFTDIDQGMPQVFDTGQVLIGLNRVYEETHDPAYRDAARRAAQWLVGEQDEDGAWRAHSYNAVPHAYYSRVGAALMETGYLLDDGSFVEAGKANLDWVLSQERANGYFNYSQFRPDEDALLHTLVYVIEGFCMAYQSCRDKIMLDALTRSATVLANISNEEGLLYSQYDCYWNATNREYCVTGLAQFAGTCFDVYRFSHDPRFLDLGSNIVNQLCRWQVWGDKFIDGALPSSIPLWGYYGGMEFFNWNVKFFIDALIKESNVTVSAIGAD